MRLCGAGFLVAMLAFFGAVHTAHAQSPRTTPLPVKTVALGKTSPGPQADPLLTQVNLAINLNQRRLLEPGRGATPWMIMHGFLALRQDYMLRVGNQPTNALQYITQTNPTHREMEWSQSEHWFEATAYGGRPHPYIKPYAFEGHVNQFLAIMSMANVPLTHEFKARDPQHPGQTKTVTMADMVNHAKMHVNQREEVSWTIWFLSNYIEPDAEWMNKDGQKWSMEQLVTMQVNAPLYNKTAQIAPCGGTHGLFALACACNSYLQKHGQLRGSWLAARQKLDNHIAYARGGQNRDGSFSSEFFKAYGASNEMGVRFKTSGHMLEWLMMALPPERLQEQWVRAATMSVANDLVTYSNRNLSTADTGAMYHALHALVLYRNRVQPLTVEPVAPPQVAELPRESMPSTTPPVTKPLLPPVEPLKPPGPLPEMKTVDARPAPIAPLPLPPGTSPQPILGSVGPVPVPPANTTLAPNANARPNNSTEGRIRLLNPPSGLNPTRRGRPFLRPITNSKDLAGGPAAEGSDDEGVATTKPPVAPAPQEPGKLPLLVPTLPALEKPEPKPIQPMPVPSEPVGDGTAKAVPPTAEEGGDLPIPLFNDAPNGGEMPAPAQAPTKKEPLPEPQPAKPLTEPTPVDSLPLVPVPEPDLLKPIPDTPEAAVPAPPKSPPAATPAPTKPASGEPTPVEPPPTEPTPTTETEPTPVLLPSTEASGELTPPVPVEPTPAKSPSSSD